MRILFAFVDLFHVHRQSAYLIGRDRIVRLLRQCKASFFSRITDTLFSFDR